MKISKMRKVLAIILGVISGIGGHFVNLRWDRAIFFFGIFFLWLIGVYFGFFLLVITGMITDPENAFDIFFKNALMYVGIGTLIIWIASLIFTIHDSYHIKEQFQVPWTVSGKIGSVFMSTIVCFMLTVVTLNNIDLKSNNSEPSHKIEYEKPDLSRFNHRLLFGGHDWKKKDYSDLPNGDSYMTGRFLFDEKPASGIKFRLWFNGEYTTEILTTNADGKFSINIPEGIWHLNRLETYSWENKPTDDPLLIVSGQEDKLKNSKYSGIGWFNKEGFSFNATKDISNIVMTLRIKREINLIWPPPEQGNVDATVKDSTIRWEPYEGAQIYLVKVISVKKEGTSKSYREISARRVENVSELSLSEFKTLDNGPEKKEYMVEVYAFASDGTFLSRTGEMYYNHTTFTLKDGKEIAKDIYFSDSGTNYTAEDLKEIADNDYRFLAVQVLIKDNMFEEAEALMRKIKGNTKKGKWEMVAGYLAAMRGDCKEADRLFSLAKVKNPDICIPDHYRANCD